MMYVLFKVKGPGPVKPVNIVEHLAAMELIEERRYHH